MTQPENLRSLLEAVANGKITPETAFDSLKDLAYQSVGEFAKIDHHRQLRTGFP
ncbi:MAG: 1-(5-phosphoribosyl)-5-amino-4-imidazole-carboxylate carboxylase, partial [Dolichospermum sp.]